MKFFLLPVFFLMSLSAFSTTLEECRSYTDNFLKKNVTEIETDEVHPYRLKNPEVLKDFDTRKLGLDVNTTNFKKWRASCVDKPDMSIEYCDNAFPLMDFMKATITGLKTGGWDEKTKTLARTKLKEYFRYSVEPDQNMLNLLISLDVMEDARLHGIWNPEKKTLDGIRKSGEEFAQRMSKEQKGKTPDCKEGEKIFQKEISAAARVRAEYSKLLKKTL